MSISIAMMAENQKGARIRPPVDPIDDNLKRVYDEMLKEDVPDRFSDLLRRLREQETPS